MNIAYLIKPKSSIAFLFDTSTLRQGLEKMKYHGYSAIPVLTKDGHYVGTVTEGDFLWALFGGDRDPEKVGISEIIRPDRAVPVTIFSSMEELLAKATEMNFVPVIDDRGFFMGIVTRKDVMRYYLQRYYDEDFEELNE